MHWLGRALATALAAAAVALAAGVAPARAQTGERIVSYDAALRVEPSGALLVAERIAYDFGAAERHGIFRDLPVRVRYDDRYDRIYPVRVLQVSGSAGTPDHYELEDVGSTLRIRVGDPDRTVSGRHDYTIVYRVEGALNGFGDHDELYWNAIGTHWAVPVERASAKVSAPAAISRVACYIGPAGSTTPCGSSGSDGSTASFAAPRLGRGEGLTVVVGFAAGAVPAPRPILDERWSLARAFSPTPRALRLAGGVLLLVLLGLGLLFRVIGGDHPPPDGAPSGGGGGVEPAPPDGVRPGQAGLLLNGVVRPLDISATLIDLAVRGYLRIEEVPRRARGELDWRLVRLKAADDRLHGYERELFCGLFSTARKDRAVVRLSKLNQKFHQRFERVRSALYEDASKRRWFTHRPDRARSFWVAVGVVLTVLGVVATILLVALTHDGLAAVPLLLAGPVLIVRAGSMISRTPAGAELRRRLVGFRAYLETAGAGAGGAPQAPDQFSPYLPYAMAFGLTEQWTRAFAPAGAPPPQTHWYTGSGPSPATGGLLPLHDFAHRSAHTLSTAPPSASGWGGSGGSGFSGGGASGGGGGGGGGGSW